MPREPRPTRSLLPATLAAVAGGALVGGLLFASVLKGPLALVVLAVLGIALPVARTLAERVVVLMVGYAGILFSLWMLPLPLPHGDLLGAAIGAGFGWSLVRGLQTGRLSRLVPQVGAPDVDLVERRLRGLEEPQPRHDNGPDHERSAARLDHPPA